MENLYIILIEFLNISVKKILQVLQISYMFIPRREEEGLRFVILPQEKPRCHCLPSIWGEEGIRRKPGLD